jgi:hypothetical protein
LRKSNHVSDLQFLSNSIRSNVIDDDGIAEAVVSHRNHVLRRHSSCQRLLLLVLMIGSRFCDFSITSVSHGRTADQPDDSTDDSSGEWFIVVFTNRSPNGSSRQATDRGTSSLIDLSCGVVCDQDSNEQQTHQLFEHRRILSSDNSGNTHH